MRKGWHSERQYWGGFHTDDKGKRTPNEKAQPGSPAATAVGGGGRLCARRYDMGGTESLKHAAKAQGGLRPTRVDACGGHRGRPPICGPCVAHLRGIRRERPIERPCDPGGVGEADRMIYLLEMCVSMLFGSYPGRTRRNMA